MALLVYIQISSGIVILFPQNLRQFMKDNDH